MEGVIAVVMESIPGFKFHPSDEELLLRYLKPKIEGTQVEDSCVLLEVEVCKYDPWNLSKIFDEFSMWKPRDGTREWTFFCPRKSKYAKGQRFERTTPSGYWKVTGAERKVKAEDGTPIGTKKTLVFYNGHVPKGQRTNWVMHEYHLSASCLSNSSYVHQLPYVASRLKLKKDKKGTNTNDYPSEESDKVGSETIDINDYLQPDEASSSWFNTPTSSTGDAYHNLDADQYSATYMHQGASDNIFASFPDPSQLDNGATPDYNPYNAYNTFYSGHGATPEYEPYNADDTTYYGNAPPPPPPLFSPSRSSDYASNFNWDYSSTSYN